MNIFYDEYDGIQPYPRDDFEVSDEDLFAGAVDEVFEVREEYPDEEKEKGEYVCQEFVSDESLVRGVLDDVLGDDSFCLSEMAIIDATNVKRLSGEYVVSRKLDGERKMGIGINGYMYLCSRGFRDIKRIPDGTLEGYILDIEDMGSFLVILDVLSSPKGVVRWKPLTQRLAALPRLGGKWLIQQYRVLKDIDYINSVYSKMKSDGLVFQNFHSPYYFGYNPQIYKWKPTGDTIDLMAFQEESDFTLRASSQDHSMIVVRRVVGDLLNGQIYECKISQGQPGVELIKVRADKLLPNSMSVVAQILLSNKYKLSYKRLAGWCRKIEPRKSNYYVDLNNDSNKIISRQRMKDQYKDFYTKKDLQDQNLDELERGYLADDRAERKGRIKKNFDKVKKSRELSSEEDDVRLFLEIAERQEDIGQLGPVQSAMLQPIKERIISEKISQEVVLAEVSYDDIVRLYSE